MSEPFPKPRAFPGAVELRGRDGQAPLEKTDPLAELARLVGREDPFRDLFPAREPVSKPARHEWSADGAPHVSVPEPFERFPGATRQRVPQPPVEDELEAPEGAYSEGDAFPSDDHSAFDSRLDTGHRDSFRLPALRDQEEGAGYGGQRAESFDDSEETPLNADLWAQGMPEQVSADPMHFVPPVEESGTAVHGSRRRTLVVLAAVLALTAGGLGATFLVRGGSAGGLTSGEPPTIMAEAGPAKIQPRDTSNQSTGGDGNTALIEKSASDNVNNAKVVNTQERPVDLAQLPPNPTNALQPDDGRVAVVNTANASPFPEPRKVKTILIRPDGSVVGEDSAPMPAANEAGPASVAVAPFDPPIVAGNGGAVAKPATPKSTARATSTPKTTGTPTDNTAPAKPKPVHAAAKPTKPAPLQTADATPAPAANDATASTVAGSFAVQLAAPATEQDAKDVMARLQKKYASELDGRAPSIRKADRGDKSVYRVRVGNLSQDDAKALCTKLQAGGGSCFVVRN